MSDSVEDIKKHITWYIYIGTALIVLTGVTVGVSYHHFGDIGNIVVALIIATLKAGLVASIFMHLFWDMFVKMAVIFKVMIFTAVFFAGMMILMLWSLKGEIRSGADHMGPLFRYEAAAPAAHHAE